VARSRLRLLNLRKRLDAPGARLPFHVALVTVTVEPETAALLLQ
jgi:hypothetical protein